MPTATETKKKAKGYNAPRTEPVQTTLGYTLKPLRGREIKAIKQIVSDNFEAVMRAVRDAEEERVKLAAQIAPGAELPAEESVGMRVAEVVLEQAFDQVWDFLGTLVDKNLDDEPWLAHLDILEALNEHDDFPTYVGRLRKLGETFRPVISTAPSSDTAPANGN